MKKYLLILGLVTVGTVVIGGSLDVSAKAKQEVVVSLGSVQCDLYVPRETADPTFVSYSSFEIGTIALSDQAIGLKFDALLPVEFYLHRVRGYNDNYLYRSQKWIRDRNLRMSGLINSFDTNKSFKTQFLS